MESIARNSTALELVILLRIYSKLKPSEKTVFVAEGRATQVPAVVLSCLTRAEDGFGETA